MKPIAPLAVLLLVISSSQALAITPPASPEFQVNAYTPGDQRSPSVASIGAGSFVVVWESLAEDGSGFGVFGRRFDSAGVPLGDEFRVNSFTTGSQLEPVVAATGAGSFVVVWSSFGQDGSGVGVFGRRFDGAGAPVGGEFQVNTYTTNDQNHPAVAANESGSFAVVWVSDEQDGSRAGVFGRAFDAAGSPAGAEFQVNSFTTFFQGQPAVAMDPAGNFDVVWTSADQNGSGVFGRRYDSSGAPLGNESRINKYTYSDQSSPSIAADATGGFVVAWQSFYQDYYGYGVFARRFDSAGAPQGGEFQVNTFPYFDQVSSSVAFDAAGGFVVAWTDQFQDGWSDGIFRQRFSRSGAPRGGEFQVNTYTRYNQSFPSVASDGDGNFVVVWTSYRQDGSSSGVFGRGFCADRDRDGLCDVDDVLLTSPLDLEGVSCSSLSTAAPIITWSPGNYDRFRVFISATAFFNSSTTVSSGSRLLTTPTYTPPAKKWKSACKKALAANPSSPALYFEVYGVDPDAAKSDPRRKTLSQVVQTSVTP